MGGIRGNKAREGAEGERSTGLKRELSDTVVPVVQGA